MSEKEIITEPVKKNLYQKIVDVRRDVNYLQKTAQSHNYTYAKGSQILKEIQTKMNEHNLVLYPKVDYKEAKSVIVTDKFGKERTEYQIDCPMSYVWVNGDNPEETFEVPFAAYGQQNDISKAFGSALTYSERYFLLKFFNIPTDNLDPDSWNPQPVEEDPLDIIKAEIHTLYNDILGKAKDQKESKKVLVAIIKNNNEGKKVNWYELENMEELKTIKAKFEEISKK